MGDVTGFLKHGRETPTRRPVPVRLRDWREVYETFPEDHLRTQASRCMDCGIPFCNNGCPLGNLIPDWNDLVYRDQWQTAMERLLAGWSAALARFVKVIPHDYKRALDDGAVSSGGAGFLATEGEVA